MTNIFDGLEEDEIIRIVGGRNRYNNAVRRMKEHRKFKLVQLISSGKYEPRETSALAEELGVTRMTVYNYIKEIEEEDGRCPRCGQILPHLGALKE